VQPQPQVIQDPRLPVGEAQLAPVVRATQASTGPGHFSPEPHVNEIDNLFFNGPELIRRKTEFALEAGLGGVMFWELGQDASGTESLLGVIRSTVNAGASPRR